MQLLLSHCSHTTGILKTTPDHLNPPRSKAFLQPSARVNHTWEYILTKCVGHAFLLKKKFRGKETKDCRCGQRKQRRKMPGARPAKDLQSKSRKGGEEAEPPPSPFRGIRPRHQRGNELSPARWAPEERSSPAGHNFFEGSRKVVPEDRGRTRSRREESNLPAPSSNGAAWESKEEASPMNSRSGPGHERERESRSGGLTPPPPRKKAGACDGTSASSKAWPHPHAQKLSRFRPLWEARLAGRLARVFAEAGSCSLFR